MKYPSYHPALILRVILVMIGTIIVGFAFIVDWYYGTDSGFGRKEQLLCAAGFIYVAVGILLRYLPTIFHKISLSLVM